MPLEAVIDLEFVGSGTGERKAIVQLIGKAIAPDQVLLGQAVAGEQELELRLVVAERAQERQLVCRVAEFQHGVGFRRRHVVDEDGVVARGLRHAAVEDELEFRRLLHRVAHGGRLEGGVVRRHVKQGDRLDAELRHFLDEVGDGLRVAVSRRERQQHDVRVVGAEEVRARSGDVPQKHLVGAGDRYRSRGHDRGRIGQQDVDLVLGDELVGEVAGERRGTLVVVRDQPDRDALVEALDEDAALLVEPVGPPFERDVEGHRGARHGAGAGIERTDPDLRRRVGRADRRGLERDRGEAERARRQPPPGAPPPALSPGPRHRFLLGGRSSCCVRPALPGGPVITGLARSRPCRCGRVLIRTRCCAPRDAGRGDAPAGGPGRS